MHIIRQDWASRTWTGCCSSRLQRTWCYSSRLQRGGSRQPGISTTLPSTTVASTNWSSRICCLSRFWKLDRKSVVLFFVFFLHYCFVTIYFCQFWKALKIPQISDSMKCCDVNMSVVVSALLVTMLIPQECMSTNRRIIELRSGPVAGPPHRPKQFKSVEQLNKYLADLAEYYKMMSRPR